MEKNAITLSVYAKLAQIILGLVGLFFILYVGASIIIPLIFALLISILLNPVVLWLTGKGINRVIAIALSILLMILFFAGISYFIGIQISLFNSDLLDLKTKFSGLVDGGQNWLSGTFGISKKSITDSFSKMQSEGLSANGVMGKTLLSFTTFVAVLILMPVYIFMFLYYKPLLLEFIEKLFPKGEHSKVGDVLMETRSLIQNYLLGLLVEMLLVAVLNSIALLLIGIKYAIFLGVIGALLNVIPYLGGIVATALPAILAYVLNSPLSAGLVIVAYLIVQFIDNNFFVPKIVASKVEVNALVAIVVVLIGGALWGVAGMFLSIPLTAIIKVIFDRIDPLKPFGFLLGDSMRSLRKNFFQMSQGKKKAIRK